LGKFIDLTGQRFGRLIVVKKIGTNKNKKIVWLCQCDCGNTIQTLGESLRTGSTKSCGCLKIEILSQMFQIDLAGKRFGRLLVIKKSGNKNGPNYKWLCLCDCGKTVDVAGGSLQSGLTNSCGCFRNEKTSERFTKDLTGMRFGRLLVIKKVGIKRKLILWECLCDCGNRVNVISAYLQTGDTTSCGCLKGESLVAIELKKYCVDKYAAIPEYKILRSPFSSNYLPYDIFIPEKDVFIEVNGIQHYERKSFFYKTDEQFDHDRILDEIKRNYAKANGTYIELDLRKIKNTKKAIEYLENCLKGQ
jgi:hypothetical protein